MSHPRGENALMMVRDWDTSPVYFSGQPSFKRYCRFVKRHQYLPLHTFTDNDLQSALPVLLVGMAKRTVHRVNQLKIANYWLKVGILTQKQDSPVTIRLISKDTPLPLQDRVARELGLPSALETDFLAMLIYSLDKGLAKYRQLGVPSPTRLRVFYSKYEGGHLSRYYRSQDPPLRNSQPVKIVTAMTFGDIALKPNKDVLVYFYSKQDSTSSPELSKHISTLFEQAAKEAIQSTPSLWLGSMDIDMNDIPGLASVPTPSVYLYPRGGKSSPRPVPISLESTVPSILTPPPLHEDL